MPEPQHDPRTSGVEFAREYLPDVVAELQRLFGISGEEAEGRVRDAFAHWDFAGDEHAAPHLGHELPDYWANWVYYGHDQDWWRDPPPADLTPLPWPEPT